MSSPGSGAQGGAPRYNRELQARSKARRLAAQALYQWQMSATDPAEIASQFRQDQEGFRGTDGNYFRELLIQTACEVETLDAALAPGLDDRSMAEVDPVERAILRMAAYELIHHLEVPYRVVINEAINLAKKFGAENSHGFVNAALDRAARQLREVEFRAVRGDAGSD